MLKQCSCTIDVFDKNIYTIWIITRRTVKRMVVNQTVVRVIIRHILCTGNSQSYDFTVILKRTILLVVIETRTGDGSGWPPVFFCFGNDIYKSKSALLVRNYIFRLRITKYDDLFWNTYLNGHNRAQQINGPNRARQMKGPY